MCIRCWQPSWWDLAGVPLWLAAAIHSGVSSSMANVSLKCRWNWGTVVLTHSVMMSMSSEKPKTSSLYYAYLQPFLRSRTLLRIWSATFLAYLCRLLLCIMHIFSLRFLLRWRALIRSRSLDFPARFWNYLLIANFSFLAFWRLGFQTLLLRARFRLCLLFAGFPFRHSDDLDSTYQGCARDLLSRDQDETKTRPRRLDRDVGNFVRDQTFSIRDETVARRCSSRDVGYGENHWKWQNFMYGWTKLVSTMVSAFCL